MGSLVPQNGGGNALVAGGFNPWAEAARGISDGAYFKFNGNKGDITFGSDDEDLPVGSRVIVDMQSMALGFICWDNSQVVEEVLVNLLDGKPPLETELTDHGPFADEDDGWREAASISMVLASYGEDDRDEAVGTKLLFKTSTGGQVRSMKKLAGQYGRLFMQHPGELPIVELGVESYMPKVKKHGKKYSLTMKIVGWVPEAEAEALVSGDGDNDDDYERDDRVVTEKTQVRQPARQVEEEPARGRRSAPVEDDVQEEAPARGRRAAPVDDEPAPARGRRSAPVEDDVQEEAPARGRRSAPVEDDVQEEAPARGRRSAPIDDEPAPARGRRQVIEDELPPVEDDEVPAPRGRRSAPVEDDANDAPPPPRRRGEAPVEDEEQVPAPRGRSPGRGAPPANARLRRFD